MKRFISIFSIIICLLVIGVIGLGLYKSGSPWTVRAQKLDDQRAQRLSEISYAIDNYWNNHKALPSILNDLTKESYLNSSSFTDPETSQPFSYLPDIAMNSVQVTDREAYHLCATFSTNTMGQNNPDQAYRYPTPVDGSVNVWQHEKGNVCFALKVRHPDMPKPL